MSKKKRELTLSERLAAADSDEAERIYKETIEQWKAIKRESKKPKKRFKRVHPESVPRDPPPPPAKKYFLSLPPDLVSRVLECVPFSEMNKYEEPKSDEGDW